MSEVNKKTIGAVAIIAIVAVAGVAAVVLMQPAPTNAIKIGVIEALTGNNSVHGRGGLVGLQVAAQEINEAGGILGRPVVLVVEDSEANPEKAVSAATKLITVDKVDFLIGGILSSEALSLAEVAADNEIIFINANAATMSLTQLVTDDYERYKYVFRTHYDVSQMMYAWFDGFTSLFPSIEKIAFMTEDYSWAHEATLMLEGYCDAENITYMDLLFAAGTTDFSPEIATLEAFNPDIVFANLVAATSTTLQKQWWTLKPDILLAGCAAGLGNPNTLMEFGVDDTNYTITYNYLWNVSLTEKTTSYFTDFVAYSGLLPFGTDSPHYDALMSLAQAIEIAGTTEASAVIQALEDNTFVGARGVVDFEENHQAAYLPGVIIQWINLEPTVIWPAEVAQGSYIRQPWTTSP